MSDIKPRLNFGQVLVHFKDTEEHSAYVKHEYMNTWQAYNDYLTAPPGEKRRVLKSKLDQARYDTYLAWSKGRQAKP